MIISNDKTFFPVSFLYNFKRNAITNFHTFKSSLLCFWFCLHNFTQFVWKFLLVFVDTIYEYLKNCMEWFNEIVGRISVYISFHILINSKGQWNILLLLKAAIIMITSISQMSAVFQNQPETSKSIDVMWHTKIHSYTHKCLRVKITFLIWRSVNNSLKKN